MGHRIVALAAVLPLAWWSSFALAQDKAVQADASAREDVSLNENADALPGFVRVVAPVPSSHLLSVAGEASYGSFAKVGSLTGPSSQYTGKLAIGVTPLTYFAARFGVRGDINQHAPDPDVRTASAYGEPEVGLRVQVPLLSNAFLGAELEARFIGGTAPDFDFSATTPTLRALFAYNLQKRTWFAGQLGFRFDNSAKVLQEEISLMRDGDRQTMSASSFNAVELGLAGSHRIGRLELVGEATADILVGKGAPPFKDGPISFDIGARYDVLDALNLRAHIEYSPSSTREPYYIDVLVATRPRFLMGIGMAYRFGVEEEKQQSVAPVREPKEEKVVAAPLAPLPDMGRVVGRVSDEAGRPLSDVRVLLIQGDEPPEEVYSDANGEFVFEGVLTGPVKVKTETPGYDSITKESEVESGEDARLDYTLYESLPAGQVRGRVLDFGGQALAAKVTISPGDIAVPVSENGSFSVDLKPGRYKVRFAHEGYSTQVRVIRVQDKGVVVLNIALEK